MRRPANTTTPNRFRKRVRRTFRFAVAAAAVISIFKLCAYAEEQRRDLIRREQRHSAMITLFFAVSTLAGLFAALAAAVAEMRKKNDDAETNPAPVDEHIPVDDEATVENF